jgi:hypothetical protein
MLDTIAPEIVDLALKPVKPVKQLLHVCAEL